jgi:hypothetical protein
MTLCTHQSRVDPAQNIALLSTHSAFSSNIESIATQIFIQENKEPGHLIK